MQLANVLNQDFPPEEGATIAIEVKAVLDVYACYACHEVAACYPGCALRVSAPNHDFERAAPWKLLQVLATLTALLAGNGSSRVRLRADVGYDTLLHMVLRLAGLAGPQQRLLLATMGPILEVRSKHAACPRRQTGKRCCPCTVARQQQEEITLVPVSVNLLGR